MDNRLDINNKLITICVWRTGAITTTAEAAFREEYRQDNRYLIDREQLEECIGRITSVTLALVRSTGERTKISGTRIEDED